MSRIIPEWQRVAGRNWRLRRRLPSETGFMVSMDCGRAMYANLARSLPRLGAFISLDGAAELRKAGQFRNARYALERAAADHATWINKGGFLP